MIQKNTMTKEGYTIRDQTLPHFITVTVVDWIDIFTRKTYRDTVIEKEQIGGMIGAGLSLLVTGLIAAMDEETTNIFWEKK